MTGLLCGNDVARLDTAMTKLGGPHFSEPFKALMCMEARTI